MKPLIIIGINLALIPVMALGLRFWLRGQPDALAAQHRLCGIILWAGALIAVAAAVISFTLPVVGLSLASSGLLIVTGMSLRRKQLARLLAERRKNDAV
jgi:hypothetical protein